MRDAFSAPKQTRRDSSLTLGTGSAIPQIPTTMIATPELVLSEILRSFLSLRMTESKGARNDRVRGETR